MYRLKKQQRKKTKKKKQKNQAVCSTLFWKSLVFPMSESCHACQQSNMYANAKPGILIEKGSVFLRHLKSYEGDLVVKALDSSNPKL